MPVNIYSENTSDCEGQIAILCQDNWDLASQFSALNTWLAVDGKHLVAGSYVADVGFCWRKEAGGGGAALSLASVQIMAEIGMCLLISEYPGFIEPAR
jgi:hypothetical protein